VIENSQLNENQSSTIKKKPPLANAILKAQIIEEVANMIDTSLGKTMDGFKIHSPEKVDRSNTTVSEDKSYLN
jgi:hypothetical protein